MLLLRHAEAFDQHQGQWKRPLASFQIKEGYKPYMTPHALTTTLKKEIDRLVAEGVLSPVKLVEWSSPTFAIPTKNQTIGVVLDFRGMNKEIVRKPCPVPLIQDNMPAIGQLKYATVMDLVIGYYSMELDPKSKEICVACLPWGLY